MPLRIATWNINSIRRRLGGLERLAADAKPDVICLQETKVQNEDFPREAVEKLGYRNLFIHGMKAYNGMAILSRRPMARMETRRCVDREDCRYAFAVIDGIEIHNCYVPAGGDVPDIKLNEKFAHKLDFLTELECWWRDRRSPRAKAILVGDLNVAPLETDVWSHKQLLDVVSHTPIEVEHLGRVIKSHDWVDAVRHFIPPEERLYSWWSYRNRDWAASDRGRRLDHVWVTPSMAGSLKSAKVLRAARGWDDASDHVPVVVEIK